MDLRIISLFYIGLQGGKLKTNAELFVDVKGFAECYFYSELPPQNRLCFLLKIVKKGLKSPIYTQDA